MGMYTPSSAQWEQTARLKDEMAAGAREMGSDLRLKNPEIYDWAKSQGYAIQQDGSYRRSLTTPAGIQVEALQEGDLRKKYQSQQYLQQASALPTSTPNYLQQIQGYMGAQQPGLEAQRAALSGYGASSQKYDNPYEQRLASLINDPNQISNTNAYKFRLNQGQQALERSAASRGMLNSGNTLAALADYGQGAASQEYGNEFNRLSSATGQQNQYNLGRMGAANQELGLRQQGYESQLGQYNTNAGTALKALTSADEMFNERKRLALGAAQQGGLLKSGTNTSLNSTW